MDSGVVDAEVEAPVSNPWSRRAVWAVAVAAVIALVTVSAQRLMPAHRRGAPYGAAAVAAQVDLTVVPATRAQATINRLAGAGRLRFTAADRAARVAVGELTFRTPHNAPTSGQYALFVLDDSGQPVVNMWAVGPVGSNVTQGWQGSFGAVGRKYRWLGGLASTNAAMAASFSPKTPAPITFVAQLGSSGQPPTVALAFLGSDGEVYWATKLS